MSDPTERESEALEAAAREMFDMTGRYRAHSPEAFLEIMRRYGLQGPQQHTHVAGYPNLDTCARCGHDIRNPIHIRTHTEPEREP